jgi:hypothetical protein
MDSVATHETTLVEAFAEVLKAEDTLREAKTKFQEAAAVLEREVALAEQALKAAWVDVNDLLAETGEFEVTLPGSVTDYKLYFTTPTQRVKVEPEAVPDEFCKIERKPKLKEIGDYLKQLKEVGGSPPNWARFEAGESKLAWKAIKKQATKEAIC